MLDNKNVLIFSPKFFNYEIEIKNTIMNLGGNVDLFNERPDDNFITKVIIRLGFNKIISHKIQNYFKSILKKIQYNKYDFCLIISPETLDESMLLKIKKTFPNTYYILYMWDSLKNKNSKNILHLFDRKFTFDYNDFQSFKNFYFLPLYYIPIYRNRESLKKKFDLLFVATAHSDRYNIHLKLLNLGKKYKFYLYLSSKKLFILNKLFNSSYAKAHLNDFNYNPITQLEIADLVKCSNVVIDINHPSQNGLTNRTLETMASSVKLITTNDNVKYYNFYNPNNILIIDRFDINIPNDFFESNYIQIEPEVYNLYSIEQFIINIFKKIPNTPDKYLNTII